MAERPTILWHDYETSGLDSRRDRPLQFACIRTTQDQDLEPIGDPILLHARLAEDVLPWPDACLVTGLRPKRIPPDAMSELELMRTVLAEMSRPGTCSAGYNNMEFDDEVTRFSLWRCLLPVYGRESESGNSRWDLLDPMRAAYALRPDGIEWPKNENGDPSFKLEHLATANSIPHEAHDALGDVRATIGLARLLRRAQPKLFDFLFDRRSSKAVSEHLRLGSGEPVVHVSRRFPSAQGCTSLVLPVCKHPTQGNKVLAVDLRQDPEPLFSLPVAEVARLLFTKRKELEEGAPRIGVKAIHLKRSPVLAPTSVLDDAVAERIGLDRAVCERNLERLRREGRLADRLREIYGAEHAGGDPDPDPDTLLYDGFPPRKDTALCERLHRTPPEARRELEQQLEDWRLGELAFRMRARSFPETLDDAEQARWREHCRSRLLGATSEGTSRLEAIQTRIAELRAEGKLAAPQTEILDDLEAFTRERAESLRQTARAVAG